MRVYSLPVKDRNSDKHKGTIRICHYSNDKSIADYFEKTLPTTTDFSGFVSSFHAEYEDGETVLEIALDIQSNLPDNQ